ncbi:MAG: thioredoxin domain-containing protein [Bacteroidota bacterium]
MSNIKVLTLLTLMLWFSHSSCQQSGAPTNLDAVAFNQKILSTDSAVLIDVRSPGEFAQGYINHAVNINFNSSDFETSIDKLDKNKSYFVYCYSGGRSSKAASYMRRNGFTKVYELMNGILAWNSKNLPLAGASGQTNNDKISMADYKKLLVSDSVVLIDYYAPWCEPCKKLQPMLEAIQQQYKGKITVISLDIDENKQLATDLSIEAIPLLKMYNKGKEVWSYKGLIGAEELKKAVEANTSR